MIPFVWLEFNPCQNKTKLTQHQSKHLYSNLCRKCGFVQERYDTYRIIQQQDKIKIVNIKKKHENPDQITQLKKK